MTSSRRAFTLVEMLVSIALVAILMLVLVQMTTSTSALWQYTTSRSEQFNHASQAFESITRRLSQATLNTYWDYSYAAADKSKTTPIAFQRQSDLRFVTDKATKLFSLDPAAPTNIPRYGNAVFFQAPLGFTSDPTDFGGLPNLLNTWGYYVEFNAETQPAIISNLGTAAPPQRYRYRLMELMEPSEDLGVYRDIAPTYAAGSPLWFTTSTYPNVTNNQTPATHLLAENIIQLVILPSLSKQDQQANLALAANPILSSSYQYDSTMNTVKPTPTDTRWLNQLPPVVQVTMVAIDEPSAARATRGSTEPTFHTSLNTFTDSTQYSTDLATLQAALVTAKLNYRVFTSNVSLRSARWSTK